MPKLFRRRAPIALYLLLAVILAAGALLRPPVRAESQAETPRPQLLYFFENYCDACHPEVEFIETFHELTGRHVTDYDYLYYNIRSESARALFNETAEACGVAPEDRFVPMVVVDGKAYVGNSKVESVMPMDFLENESTESLLYYLYSPACESCAAAEKHLEGTPESVTVRRGQVEFESAVRIEQINIYDNPSAAQALFERYCVPEDQRTTPIVFLGEDYVRGADDIESRLPYMLRQGKAIGTPLISETKEADLSALTVAGTAAAGFVAGFNPCALSMLLLFLSVLLASGERAGRYAAAYLVAKLVTYMAVGTALLSLLSAWNPTWLPTAAKVILTVIGGALIVLNLLDAWNAHRRRYGEIKNQLPGRVRGFLDRHIRASLKGHGAALMASVAALGVVVAASEFLCSGQLYLASLTAGLSAGTAYGRMLLLLLVFSLAFVLPSAVVTFVVVRSRNMLSASNAILRRMPLIKLITAVAMLGIILAAWLLV
ncbi:MAG: hypothetical protein IJJ23_08330 [Clostridia bacterium]|nr:hypothetical protein [Clostridia bacterium]